jgi:uncharacterized membrane protein YsdA (DUF1294 family)
MGDILRLIGVALLLLGALAATLVGLAPAWVLAAYLMLGIVSFGVYGFDKRAARRGDWRVPETTLHGIDLIGGIAGGLVGQVVFRHKTRKGTFVLATGLVCSAHVVALAFLILGLWRFPEALFFD